MLLTDSDPPSFKKSWVTILGNVSQGLNSPIDKMGALDAIALKKQRKIFNEIFF